MKVTQTTTLVWLTFVAMAAVTAQAGFLDPLDTTDNFTGGFGGTTATADGLGTVLLTRTQSGVDAGIDWRPPGGTGFLDLAAPNRLLSITPVDDPDNDFWNVNILFWTDSNGFITELNWLGDANNASTTQTLDVIAMADANGLTTAAKYYPRFRIQPFTYTGDDPTVRFTEIETVPEPTSCVMLALALLLGCRCRRGT